MRLRSNTCSKFIDNILCMNLLNTISDFRVHMSEQQLRQAQQSNSTTFNNFRMDFDDLGRMGLFGYYKNCCIWILLVFYALCNYYVLKNHYICLSNFNGFLPIYLL